MPVTLTVDEIRRVRESQVIHTGTRFCSSCGYNKTVEGGGIILGNKGHKRWKCAGCQAKSKPPTRS